MTSVFTSRFLKSSTTTSVLVGNVVVREHVFTFPLDWREIDIDSATRIDVFVREVASSSAAVSDPAILYLQGGPGFPSPRPSSPVSGWMKVALEKGYRVLLMDQRGTGGSTAMSVQRLLYLEKQGGVELQARYLSHMRSDAIADDVEVGLQLLINIY
jgi:pimeloyl-ACP methyl ester carboxylesterase